MAVTGSFVFMNCCGGGELVRGGEGHGDGAAVVMMIVVLVTQHN